MPIPDAFRRAPVAILIFLLAARRAPAGDPPPLMNLGAPYVWFVDGPLLFYPRPESMAGKDFNGDRDRRDWILHVHDLSTGTTRNTGSSGQPLGMSGHRVVLSVYEMSEGKDLNGDRDLEDYFLFIHDLDAGTTSGTGIPAASASLTGRWFATGVMESSWKKDLNGDGDQEDTVVHVHDIASGETRNLRLALYTSIFHVNLSGTWAVFEVGEDQQREDLNGDGDRNDSVVHVHDLETGETRNTGRALGGIPLAEIVLSGKWLAFQSDGNQIVIQDLSSGATRSLAANANDAQASGSRLVFDASESSARADLDGDGDTKDFVAQVHDLDSGETRNLGIAVTFFWTEGRRVNLYADESSQGMDMNGDGDAADVVYQVHDLSTATTRNTGLAVSVNLNAVRSQIAGDRLALFVDESSQGMDLNGDGDREDGVVHLFDLASGEARNLGIAAWQRILLTEDMLAIEADEERQGRDLNGDGDASDPVVHVHDIASGETRNLALAVGDISSFGSISSWAGRLIIPAEERAQGSDLNGDGDTDDTIIHLYDPAGGVVNLGVAGYALRGSAGYGLVDLIFLKVNEEGRGEDLNGDGDADDREVIHVLDLAALSAPPPRFIRGDGNGDGSTDLADAIAILLFQFLGGTLDCIDAADVDDDGATDLSDAIGLLGFLFLEGPEPPEPFRACGVDPEPDWLGCERPPVCGGT